MGGEQRLKDRRSGNGRRNDDPDIAALASTVHTMERFVSEFITETKETLKGIAESLKQLTELNVNQRYQGEAVERAFKAIGQNASHIATLLKSSGETNLEVGKQGVRIDSHGYWLKLVGAAVILGVLGFVGSVILKATGVT